MRDKIVRTVLYKCLGYRRGEVLLIVTDDRLESVASVFYRSARRSNIETLLVKMAPRHIHGQEPPASVARLLTSVDLALLITEKSLSHTKARKEACHKYGVRIASLPGLTEAMLKRCMVIDYSWLNRKVSKFATLLTKAKSLKVVTKKGTDVVMSLEGRKAFKDNGLYTRPGAFGNLPAGEACIAPVEGSTNGRVVIDASMASIGKLRKPIEFIIRDGVVRKTDSKHLTSFLKPFGKSALNIAEFGIGLNPKAVVTGNVLEDEKAIGTAHIAVGDNKSFGGSVSAPCHLDGVFFHPQIWIDGRRVKHIA